jgi:hypothetical protein
MNARDFYDLDLEGRVGERLVELVIQEMND